MGNRNVENWDDKTILKLLKILSKTASNETDPYLSQILSLFEKFQNLKESLNIFNSRLFLRSVIKLGNSLAITIPQSILEKTNLEVGDYVLLHYKEDLCFLYLGNNFKKESLKKAIIPSSLQESKSNKKKTKGSE